MVPETRRGEFDLIAELFAPLAADDPRALGLTDDAAILPQSYGTETVITTDTMVLGVHFFEREDPAVVARRLLRVNLSDIAAMAAAPVGYFLNLTLADNISDSWLEGFCDGLRADQDLFGVRILGGDTTRTPGPLTLSVTMMGEVPAGQAVRRSGASDGDLVMVSGTIGDAALGLAAFDEGRADSGYLIGRFQSPTPRLPLGRELRGIATAMADVSDGLIADIGHICKASGIGAEIDGEAVPLSPDARAAMEAGDAGLSALLSGGDDYELVFAVPRDRRDSAEAAGVRAEVPVSVIGVFRIGATGITVSGPDGKPLAIATPGYRHF